MAIEFSDTTSMQAGKSMRPSFLSGFVSSATRCTSHFVRETTLAKPIAEQMAKLGGQRGDVYNIYLDGSALEVDERVAEALRALVSELKRTVRTGRG